MPPSESPGTAAEEEVPSDEVWLLHLLPHVIHLVLQEIGRMSPQALGNSHRLHAFGSIKNQQTGITGHEHHTSCVCNIEMRVLHST